MQVRQEIWQRSLPDRKRPLKVCDGIALRSLFSGDLTDKFYNGSMCAIPCNTLFNIYKVLGFNEERGVKALCLICWPLNGLQGCLMTIC